MENEYLSTSEKLQLYFIIGLVVICIVALIDAGLMVYGQM
jgi:cytochrome c biogenesis protein ResB